MVKYNFIVLIGLTAFFMLDSPGYAVHADDLPKLGARDNQGGLSADQSVPKLSSRADERKLTVAADQDPEWAAARDDLKRRLRSDQLSDEQACLLEWDTLWTWSKKGNLEARLWLLSRIFPIGPDAGVMFLPGSEEGDLISLRRDALIFVANIAGIRSSDEDMSFFKEISEFVYSTTLNDDVEGSAWLKCLKTQPQDVCARDAIAARTVPSFDEYAKQIDAFLAQKIKPHCRPGYPGRRRR